METAKLPTLVYLDVETTGLSPYYNDKICEIALLRCAPGEPMVHWQSLVNPLRPISPGAGAVNGITDAMVADAPPFRKIVPAILDFIKDTVLVCHNAPFDLSFLSAELESCSLVLPNLPVIDTLKIARQHFDFPSNSLGNIAQYLGIEIKEKHRALADVYTTQKIFAYFWSELQKRGITSVETLLSSHVWFPGQTTKRAEPDTLPPLLEEAIRAKQKVQLRYESRTGTETQRIIKPLEIVNSLDYLYLVAFCQLRQEKRTFRLDRIIEMKIL